MFRRLPSRSQLEAMGTYNAGGTLASWAEHLRQHRELAPAAVDRRIKRLRELAFAVGVSVDQELRC